MTVPPYPPASQYDYDYSMVLIAQLLQQSFHSLVIAAMIRGDTENRQLLADAFPGLAADLRARGHNEIPQPNDIRAER